VSDTREAILLRAEQNVYRNSVTAWFKRWGVVKDRDGTIVRFPNMRLYSTQKKMFAHYDECRAAKKPCREIVLKWRKGGASTGAQAMMYHSGRKFAGRGGAVMGDVAGTSDTIFEIYRTFATNDGFDWGDGFGNLVAGDKANDLTDDITLPNKSTYKKVTAGSTNANRSGTIQFANSSETSFYKSEGTRDPLTAFLGSWSEATEASLGIIDSTSDGPFGKFYDYFMDERNQWFKIFVAWFEDDENRIPFVDTSEEMSFRRSMEKREHELVERFGLGFEQLNWLRDKLLNKCGGSIEQLNKEYPSTKEDAFLVKSALRFNITVLENIERRAKVQPPTVGNFITQPDGGVQFLTDPQGSVKIFEPPQHGLRYLGAFDPCTGRDQQNKGAGDDPDYHSIQVLRDEYLDPRNGQHFPPMIVAHHHSRIEVEVAVEIAAAMSRHYGNCQFVVETNGCGLYPVKALAALNVPLWARKQRAATPGQTELANGWQSNEQLRKTIIDTLGSAINQWKPEVPTFDLFDLEIIHELKKMVNHNGRPQAMAGEHDDTVLAFCLAYYCRTCATLFAEPKRPKIPDWKILSQNGWKLQKPVRL